MSIQASHFILGQASATPDDVRVDEAVYTFTGALNGAGREFDFCLFGIAQGSEDAGPVLRDTVRQLLREVYLPLLPWDATDRPNTLEVITNIMNASQSTLTDMAVAVVLDNRVYMGWQGDGRVYMVSVDGIQDLFHNGVEPVTSQVFSPGMSLLLCTGGVWKNLSEAKILQGIQQAASVQDACDQLVSKALSKDDASRPLALMIHRPA